jgi:hypothetical protein
VEAVLEVELVVDETAEDAAATGDDTLVIRLTALPLLMPALLASSVVSGVGTWVTRLRETGAGGGGLDVVGFGLNLAVAGETRTARYQVNASSRRRKGLGTWT